MDIRTLNVADAQSYRSLRVEALLDSPEAFVTTYEEEMSKKDPIHETATKLKHKNSIHFGAFKKEKLVGTVTLQLETFKKTKHKAHLLAMYVSPDARGMGIGRALLTETINKAKELGIEQLQLTVVSNNEAAKTLYTQCGFTVYGVEKEALKINDLYVDEVDMVLFLNEI
ncbi:GNAT family N-acetyltransferase [Lentibacillus sp. Marseille-P4043]|uniref:GNAT family N-acetyltransferase n=1 Tax=Lentibacillus sp. Marseille-P4043 TaxID=2040293 RepID=UPI000D0B0DAC|nr:GNAT family N-acetyltransferase [Lentibacillus sp. Marseille-P4043]